MVFLETLKRIRITRLPTAVGNYNFLGMYMDYEAFDCLYVAKALHVHMSILPKKAMSVMYLPGNDPFDPSNTEDTNYVFLDFLWMVDDSNVRRQLGRGNEIRIQRSPTEVWVISLQDPQVNLMHHSHASTTMYFSDHNSQEDADYWRLANDMPFDGGEGPESITYRNANIRVTRYNFITNEWINES